MLRHIASLTTLLVIAFAYPPQIAFANHGQLPHWVNDSKDQYGNGCCGEQDCIPVSFAYVLGEKEGKTLVSIEGSVGLINSHTLARKCPLETPQAFLCVYTTEFVNGVQEMCLLRKLDGTAKEFRITPNCIRCLLIIECGGNLS